MLNFVHKKTASSLVFEVAVDQKIFIILKNNLLITFLFLYYENLLQKKQLIRKFGIAVFVKINNKVKK